MLNLVRLQIPEWIITVDAIESNKLLLINGQTEPACTGKLMLIKTVLNHKVGAYEKSVVMYSSLGEIYIYIYIKILKDVRH